MEVIQSKADGTARTLNSGMVRNVSQRESRSPHFMGRWLHASGTAAGVLLCLIAIPLLIINLTILITSWCNPDQVPNLFGYKPLIVLSGSMFPAIQVDDMVVVRTVDPETLQAGDIISYSIKDQAGGKRSVITHRIEKITETEGEKTFVTKGDANNTSDLDPVSMDAVEGQYLFRIKGLGKMAMFLQTPRGILICMGIPIILLMICDTIRSRFFKKKDKQKMEQMEEELRLLKKRTQSAN